MSQNVIEITDVNFGAEVLSSSLPVLLDFWASWCGPCLAIAPHIEALANEYVGKLRVGKVNVDDHPQTATQFGIRSIPTLIVFKDGKPVEQVVGASSKSKLQELIDRHL